MSDKLGIFAFMKYDDFDNETKLELWFIVCEMTLVFFKHKTKLQAFDAFCHHIRGILISPPCNVKSLKNTVLYNLTSFLIFNLNRQYGLNSVIATDLMSDFFVECRWTDIYEIQSTINNETIPNGYGD